MKIKHLLLLIIFSVVQLLHSQNSSLQIVNWDGMTKSIELSSLTKITFSGTDMLLNYSTKLNENYPTSSIRKLLFGTSTGFEKNNAYDDAFNTYPNPAVEYFSLRNLHPEKVTLTIYNLNGIALINQQNITENDKIDVRNLVKGFYLVKINNKVVTFRKI